MPPDYATYITASLLGINLWTVLAFWLDKRAAVLGQRRTSEVHLLSLALIGGTPGAFLARQMFRHKTRKQPFSLLLWGVAVVQVGLAIGFLLPL